MRVFVLLFAAAVLAPMAGGCASVANAQARDPMHCERDPACAKARGAYPDCTKQCVDDPECEDRCLQVREGNDGLGH